MRIRYLRNRSYTRIRHSKDMQEFLAKESAATGKTPNQVFNSYREPGYTLDPGGEYSPGLGGTPIGLLLSLTM